MSIHKHRAVPCSGLICPTDIEERHIIIIIIIEKHTSEGAKEQKQHKLSYMVEAEDTIKSNSD